MPTALDSRARSALVWLLVPVVLSAIYSFVVLELPARGLTFFLDDWQNLRRFGQGVPLFAALSTPKNEHWNPLFMGFLGLEHAVFGTQHDLYLLATWAIHVLNVFLLTLVLRGRLEDPRVAALGAATFGLADQYREVLWWAELGGMALGLTTILVGFLAMERSRRSGSLVWTVVAAAAALLAPCWIAFGVALGPALLLETFFLEQGARRRTSLAIVGGGLAAYLGLYAVFASRSAGVYFPRVLSEWVLAGKFAVNLVGAGMVGRFFLNPGGEIVPAVSRSWPPATRSAWRRSPDRSAALSAGHFSRCSCSSCCS